MDDNTCICIKCITSNNTLYNIYGAMEINKNYARKNQALIVFGKKFKHRKNYFNLSTKGSLKEAANNLYQIMRKIKKRKFNSIAVVKIPNKGIGCAINERLKKAANY